MELARSKVEWASCMFLVKVTYELWGPDHCNHRRMMRMCRR